MNECLLTVNGFGLGVLAFCQEGGCILLTMGYVIVHAIEERVICSLKCSSSFMYTTTPYSSCK
jgi:hypothetical protein